MPYIKQDRRIPLTMACPLNAGELNYAFTKMILAYIKQQGPSYQHINDVIGALEGAKMEFYRRYVAEYENKKADENGDVYPKEVDIP
jgi:hypothetical protein